MDRLMVISLVAELVCLGLALSVLAYACWPGRDREPRLVHYPRRWLRLTATVGERLRRNTLGSDAESRR